MKLLKLILGESYKTSIIGYVIAGLIAVQTSMQAGETDWGKLLLAAGLAIFARFSGDSTKQ